MNTIWSGPRESTVEEEEGQKKYLELAQQCVWKLTYTFSFIVDHTVRARWTHQADGRRHADRTEG